MKFVFACIFALFSLTANADALWSFSFHDLNGGDPYADSFDGSGYFTTKTNDLSTSQPVLSFTGTFTDDYVSDASIALIPTGQTVVAGYGLVFDYDNLIGGPGLFTNPGVLFTSGLTSHVNLYGDGTGNLFAYDYHTSSDGSPGGFFASAFINFDYNLVSYTPPPASTVGEPLNLILMLFGGLMLLTLRLVLKTPH